MPFFDPTCVVRLGSHDGLYFAFFICVVRVLFLLRSCYSSFSPVSSFLFDWGRFLPPVFAFFLPVELSLSCIAPPVS